jgi:hypothetical protein
MGADYNVEMDLILLEPKAPTARKLVSWKENEKPESQLAVVPGRYLPLCVEFISCCRGQLGLAQRTH